MSQDDNQLPQVRNKILLLTKFSNLSHMLALLRDVYDGPLKTITGLEADAIEAPSKTLQNNKTRFIEDTSFRIRLIDSPKLTEGWTDATQEES